MPTTSMPTTSMPTTSAPTAQCEVFLNMNMNDVPGQWTQLSTYAAEAITGSPECANDGGSCWKMDSWCYYSRIISTNGYQNISLMFHLYESNLESDEYCRIKYRLPNEGTATTVFEQHGYIDIYGEKTVILPHTMSNQNNLTLYVESISNGGTLGNEFCYFDNIYLCGWPATASQSNTSIPTTNTPTTYQPTTITPTTSTPTTYTPTTMTPTTYVPTTSTPTTFNPTTIYPTTHNPTTFIPTTHIPTTITPTTNNPTTLVPTTNTPSTNVPTTNIP
eukprot:91860_1